MDYSIAALFSETFALNKGPDNTFNQRVLIGKNSRFCHLIRPGFNDFIITKINGGMNDGTFFIAVYNDIAAPAFFIIHMFELRGSPDISGLILVTR